MLSIVKNQTIIAENEYLYALYIFGKISVIDLKTSTWTKIA